MDFDELNEILKNEKLYRFKQVERAVGRGIDSACGQLIFKNDNKISIENEY